MSKEKQIISFFSGVIFLILSLLQRCMALDRITPAKFLTGSETLVSSNGDFKLGFFSPMNSKDRYAGIWYSRVQLPQMGIAWVANQDNPVTGSSGGAITISEEGNLIILNGENRTVWSTGVSSSDTNKINARVAKLLDSGNLVLMEEEGKILWQSFDHATDTALPNMKLTVTKDSNTRKMLQSWKNLSDPSHGKYWVGIDSFAFPQLVIWDENRPYWRSGPWNGNNFIGTQNKNSGPNIIGAGFILENDRQGTVSLTYYSTNRSSLSIYSLSYQGDLTQKWWNERTKKWDIIWKAPQTKCDLYAKCGEFGKCNSMSSPICRCLKGFEPKSKVEWNQGNFTNGCIRRTKLQCQTRSGKPDGFLRVKTVKVPDQADWSTGLDQNECRSNSQNNCSCLAYAYVGSAGCMSWGRGLIDTEEIPSGGVDLYIRLAHSELGNDDRVVIIITVFGCLGAILMLILVLFLWRWRNRKKEKELRRNTTVSDMFEMDEKEVHVEEVPLFEFKRLAMATNNFQDSNKLGQGGFGPVYKGRLEGGHEIAVKRLSAASGQGTKEFMNEVQLISKLQHRNLVRLLGCCVDRTEKMLVYEYMPNGSLDSLLFDPNPEKRELLPWKTRYNIILGISRGLLYLHRDSRLKIIHRDLKASNILLDENLNPKISDFGLARIFGGNQEHDDTIRVVGTYGYMSPEYAMEGKFSEKSDVFSYGVLLLEMVSGQRNSLFWYEEKSLSLIGYVYKLWTEDNLTSIIDPVIAEPDFLGEIQRCIQVGLLCVQEAAKDRPCISTVISMLSSETIDLPYPKQPGFTHRQISMNVGSSSQPSQQSQQSSGAVYVSVTILSAR